METISTIKLAQEWMSIVKQGFGWVFYRFPGTDKIYFTGGDTTAHSIDEEGVTGFVMAPFYHPGERIWRIENNLHIQLGDKDFSGLKTLFDFNHIPRPNATSSTKQDYVNLVEKTIAEIESGAMKKAVPARIKEVDLNDIFSPFSLFNSLLETYPNAFVYLLHTPQTGAWIGSTPETLLKVSDNILTTLSLAGTKKTGGDDSNPFTIKETEEQAIVTRYIREILEKFCRNIFADGPHPINAGNISHLATYFNGQLKSEFQNNYLQIVKELHPTPAVCGMPLQVSRDFLLKNENFDRSLYSGFLGPITSTTADLFVNLRCMEFFTHFARLYAGAGVVSGSIPEKEWLETEEKMNTLQRFL